MEKNFEKLKPPEGGIIEFQAESPPVVPSNPIIPFIKGDGVGPDIWRAARMVLNEAIKIAFNKEKEIVWFEIFAGENAQKMYGKEILPNDTLQAVEKYAVAIKGPLTTPVAGGYRSLNVAMRQKLDLYACVRPVRYIPGVPSPVKHPELLNVVIFRENTEDVYLGIEWPEDSKGARRMVDSINDLRKEAGENELAPKTAIGIKPISEKNSRRLIHRAVRYAIENSLPNVTFVHKGNIMKFTEGAFRDLGFAIAREDFGNFTISENEVYEKYDGKPPNGKIVVKDQIADAMFQKLILRPNEYSVIATMNLNGDYLSDAAAAQVGGLGVAPGYNIGDRAVIFEATHGTAPRIAGQDKANPTALILSGVEMLRFMGWDKAADLIIESLTRTILDKVVTYDLARQLEDATEVKTSEFAGEIIQRMWPNRCFDKQKPKI
jgi:isocitrate dehydrogenase